MSLQPNPLTANDPIELIRSPEKLVLLEPDKTNGYYHFRAAEGEEGWIRGKNVKVISTADQPETPVQPTTSPAGPAETVSAAWMKGTRNKVAFFGIEGDCPFDGNGFDPDQFMLKNRTDVSSAYNDVTWAAISTVTSRYRSFDIFLKITIFLFTKIV